jgi:hypothetical protein
MQLAWGILGERWQGGSNLEGSAGLVRIGGGVETGVGLLTHVEGWKRGISHPV